MRLDTMRELVAPDGTDSQTGSHGEAPAGTDVLVQAVIRALDEEGMGGALRLLNARTRYRFTGVYRAEAAVLRNVYLYDRENPTLNLSGDVTALEASYCSIVLATEAPFNTADASLDERLATHQARASVISYAGVPLRLPNGRAWGTLCHFDVRPRLMPPAEQIVLAAVAPALLRWAMEHPTP